MLFQLILVFLSIFALPDSSFIEPTILDVQLDQLLAGPILLRPDFTKTDSTTSIYVQSAYRANWPNGNYDIWAMPPGWKPADPVPDPTPTSLSITIMGITDGQTISGNYHFSVLTDITKTSQIEGFVDGALFRIERQSPYDFWIDTTKYSSGSHELKIVATDTGGIKSEKKLTFKIGATSAPPPAPLPSGSYFMMNCVTWTSANGCSTLHFEKMTDLSIFHVTPNADGTISYDGSYSNVQNAVNLARSKGIRISLAFGGAGLDKALVDDMLSTPEKRAKVINSIVAEVNLKGYNAVEDDLEDSYDKANMVAFDRELRAKLPSSVQLNRAIDDWFIDPDTVAQMEPYISHFHLMFDPSPTEINAWAAKMQNPKKLAIGFELGLTTNLKSKIDYAKSQGYGLMFWEASKADSTFWSYFEPAPAPIGTRALRYGIYSTTATDEVNLIVKKYFSNDKFDLLSDDKAGSGGPYFTIASGSWKAIITPTLTRITTTKKDQAIQYGFTNKDVISYDLEHWDATPVAEKVNPPASMAQGMDLIHSIGYSGAIDPDGDYLMQYWDKWPYAKADVLVMQLQRWSGATDSDRAQLLSWAKKISEDAKAKNPNIVVFTQISFRQSSNCYEKTASCVIDVTQSLNNLKKSIDELDKIPTVDGVRIVYLPDSSGNPCDPILCNPANLDQIFGYVKNKVN